MDCKLQLAIRTYKRLVFETDPTRTQSRAPGAEQLQKNDHELAFAQQLAYALTVTKGNIAAVSIVYKRVFWTRNHNESTPQAEEALGKQLLRFCQDLANSDGQRREVVELQFHHAFLKLAAKRIKTAIVSHWGKASTYVENLQADKKTPDIVELWIDTKAKYEMLDKFWKRNKKEDNLQTFEYIHKFLTPFCATAQDLFDEISHGQTNPESDFSLIALKKLSQYLTTLIQISTRCCKPKYKQQITSIEAVIYIPPTSYETVTSLGPSIEVLIKPCVHAELNLLNSILQNRNSLPRKIRVGVGKNVCWLCAEALERYPLKERVVIRPSYDNLYLGWCAPPFLTSEAQSSIRSLVEHEVAKLELQVETMSDESRFGDEPDPESTEVAVNQVEEEDSNDEEAAEELRQELEEWE